MRALPFALAALILAAPAPAFAAPAATDPQAPSPDLADRCEGATTPASGNGHYTYWWTSGPGASWSAGETSDPSTWSWSWWSATPGDVQVPEELTQPSPGATTEAPTVLLPASSAVAPAVAPAAAPAAGAAVPQSPVTPGKFIPAQERVKPGTVTYAAPQAPEQVQAAAAGHTPGQHVVAVTALTAAALAVVVGLSTVAGSVRERWSGLRAGA